MHDSNSFVRIPALHLLHHLLKCSIRRRGFASTQLFEAQIKYPAALFSSVGLKQSYIKIGMGHTAFPFITY